MPAARPTLLSWSSGKDSCYALAELREDPEVEILGLLTTVNEAADRVAMHAVRRELLERQADALDLPLRVVELPDPCSNAIYEQRMGDFVAAARAEGIECVAFGDLFLEDIRAYRERQLEGTGLAALFPLWGRDTGELAEAMLAAGLVAHLSCVDTSKLDRELAGRRWDRDLLRELPAGVDPCGEHGEFHTFVSDGPGFAAAIEVRPGEIVERGGFAYADLVP